MVGCILTVLAALLGGVDGEAGRITSCLKSRFLGSLIQEGMTAEQVERILGKDQHPIPVGGCIGGVCFRSMIYYDLGISLSLIQREDGV